MLKTGYQELVFWPFKLFPKDISCYGSNRNSKSNVPRFKLGINIKKDRQPIKYGREVSEEFDNEIYKFQKYFITLTFSDPKKVKQFERRFQYKNDPSKLPIILKTINWCSVQMRQEGINIYKSWAEIKDSHALTLLQHEIADSEIRSFAVEKLNRVSNRLLANFMPQLVQALKFECHHASKLGDMLLSRALKSSRIVGHAYYWALNASLYDEYTFERLYLHYERFLFLCPHYRQDIYFQTKINDAIIDINYMAVNDPEVQKDKDMTILGEYATECIEQIKSDFGMGYFILPNIPHIPLAGISRCFWITF